jgi:hypothetical protein
MNEMKMKLVCVGVHAALIVQKTYELETLVVSKDGQSVLAGNLENRILVTNNKAAILKQIEEDAKTLPSAELLWDLIQHDGSDGIKEVEGIVMNARLV